MEEMVVFELKANDAHFPASFKIELKVFVAPYERVVALIPMLHLTTSRLFNEF